VLTLGTKACQKKAWAIGTAFVSNEKEPGGALGAFGPGEMLNYSM